MIRVLFFGPVAERVGSRELPADYTAGMRLQDLRDKLAMNFPQAFDIVCFSAVNGEQVHDMNLPLADGSEVAFMARYSGG
ncbi:MAG: MoaD/ThiS family protein [Gallionella sp.]